MKTPEERAIDLYLELGKSEVDTDAAWLRMVAAEIRAAVDEATGSLAAACKELMEWVVIENDRCNPEPLPAEEMSDCFRAVIERAKAAIAAYEVHK